MSRLTVLDEVAWEGNQIPGDRTAALLRALAEAGPAGLSEDELADEIWTDEAPSNPRKALQVVVSRARSATSAAAIERTRRGYRLALAPTEVDAWALRPEGLRLAAEGRYVDALPLLERTAPDDEVMVALLKALAAVHGVPAALERYGRYRTQLIESLGVDPSPELQAQYAALLAADRPVRAGVRFDVDRLIGREADVAALRVLIRTHRVVSIVGTGGLGKTRLAHVLARSAEQPVVHVVELAGVTSPEGVAVAVGDALGVRESVAGRPVPMRSADLFTRLVDAVGSVPMLLILDNCEHLVAAAADIVAALVTRTPRLTVLTTTRVPLGLPEERTYLLPELPPDDAAALFVERATAARPAVVLDRAEVSQLVAQLDGLPLALELAAAQVRSMSVVEITRRLDNRFALLRGGSRVAPERHQTLLAVIDWSWNLLTEQQRVALRRLAVFRDGFSLDAATTLLGHDATDVVTALVEHSLISVREAAGVVRYRLLETVREFGRMQLVNAGDDTFAEQRLMQWASDLALHSLVRLFTPDQVATVGAVRSEEGNLVDVLRRAIASRDTPTVATLFTALAGFWMIEGTHLKVLNLGPAVTELLVAEPTPPELADVVRGALAFAVTNDIVFRDAAGGPGFERLRQLGPGPAPMVGAATRVLIEGFAGLQKHGDLTGLQSLSEDPDPTVARVALLWLSHAHENFGDLVAARAAAQRALALTDDSIGPWLRGILSAMVADLALHRGDLSEARTYVRQALPVLRALGAVEDYAQTRASLAMIELYEGRLPAAEAIFDELAAEDGGQLVLGRALALSCGRAELLLARGEIQTGLAAYVDALAAMRAIAIELPNVRSGLEPWLLVPQAALVAAHVRHGLRVQAERDDLLAKARELTNQGGFIDVPVLGCTFLALAVWELTFGDRDAGAALLAYAERYAFSRMLPSLDWAWATTLAQPADIGPGTPAQLYESVHAVLCTLRP